MKTLWSERYAQRTHTMQGSAVRELLKLTEKPDIISFAGGMPAPELFPVKEFSDATRKVLAESGKQALQYGPTEGCRKLRELIARHTARYGIKVGTENILITTASQQALDLLGKIFINPGDRIVVEQPTYLGALQAWNMYQARYVSVPLDEEGMRTDLLEEAMRTGPKFLYALPNFQNPTGVTLSEERRRRIIELADHYGVPIVEDDPYGQLRFEGEHLTPLFVLDSRTRAMQQDGSNVVYLSTFSKTLAPGIRLGWIVAPAEVIQKLVTAKQGTDLHTSTLVQMVAHEISRGGFLDKHAHQVRSVYKARRDTILAALERNMPEGVHWTRPLGGLFTWVTLPGQIDAADLLREAVEEGVAFVPGAAFHADGSGRNTMRLNFSYASPELIEEGIRRLGGVLKRQLAAVACLQA